MICDPCYSGCFGKCENKRCDCPECGGVTDPRIAAVNEYLMGTHLGYDDCTDHAVAILAALDGVR